MSNVGEKAAVFRTTKVRTKLKGDSSWLQQRSDSQTETTDEKVRTKLKGDSSWLQGRNDSQADAVEEKPWMAELRNCRQNGDDAPTSPVSSPTKSTQPPANSEAERTPTSGFLIRGIFTKLDSPSSPTNSFSGSTQIIKKPSESYKKIAPHTVKSSTQNQESLLSEDEQQKRREAASSVLKKSAARQRSYVLSAAKKFESPDDASEPSLDQSNQSFVATRVEIIDDEIAGSAKPTTVATTPQPKPRRIVSATSAEEEPAAPKKEATPEAGKEAPPLVPEKDPFEHMKPGCTKVDTPLPELSLECVQSADAGTKAEASQLSGQTDEALVKCPPAIPTLIPPVAAPPKAASPAPEAPAPVSTILKAPAPTPAVPEPTTQESTAPAVVVPESPTLVSSIPKSPTPTSPVPTTASTTPEPTAPALVNPHSPAAVSVNMVSPVPPSSVPESPASVSDIAESATPNVVITETPAAVPVVLESPTPTSPVPESPAPVSTTPGSPTPTSPVPESPAPVSTTPGSPTPTSPVPESPAPVSTTPGSPTPSYSCPRISCSSVHYPRVSNSNLTCPRIPCSSVQHLRITRPIHTVPRIPCSGVHYPRVSNPIFNCPRIPCSDSPTSTSPILESQAAVSFVPVPPASAVTETTEKTEQEPLLNLSSRDDTLVALSDTLISFDTSTRRLNGIPSSKDDDPERETSPTAKHADDKRAEETPIPELSNCVAVTDDLLAFTSGPEEPPEPIPPSPGRWSQDLLADLGGESEETRGTLDLLADDVTFISTEAAGLNVEPEEEKQAADGMRSSTETVTTTTKTVILIDKGRSTDPEPWSSNVTTTVVESSLADPFDPYPIGSTAPNSSADLLQPDSDIPINSVSTTYTVKKDPGTNMSSATLGTLADDIIPIDTGAARLSTRRSWARTWETGTAEQSQEAEAEDGDQKMFVMFERKSAENDSPWDRWTSPAVYTTTTEEEEKEEEEEEEECDLPKDTQMETVTTITTIREIQSEREPAMDHYGSYSRTLIEEDQRLQTPSPEAKKPFVYVKEYINTTALSLHSASGSSYSSGSESSTCTYCGKLVGNDAKITIEHLNVNSHPHCFKCAVCSKPMGDLLDSMFIHAGKVNCESCYSRAFD
eukprot:XP_011609095.1 PREDICTED: zinc finger protein 185 [Takifugu rubripes]